MIICKFYLVKGLQNCLPLLWRVTFKTDSLTHATVWVCTHTHTCSYLSCQEVSVPCLCSSMWSMLHISLVFCRRLYILCTYLLLGFNVLYGGAMSFLRILGSLVFNICMVFRLDRDLYMRGLEGWDLGTSCGDILIGRLNCEYVCLYAGHRTYVSYLYLESTTNNAIVQTFINLLQQSIHRRRRHRQRKWTWLLRETPQIYGNTPPTPDTLSVTSTESASPNNHSQGKTQLILSFLCLMLCVCVCSNVSAPRQTVETGS